ncbi:antibiotic biosynthesis monooxygenase family protein [Chloroflexota bacterium]
MFVRMTMAEIHMDKIDETIKVFEDYVVPMAKSQKGLREVYLLTDRKRGKGVAISFWDSEEDAIASEQNGYYQEQVNKFMRFFIASPTIEGYQVSVPS